MTNNTHRGVVIYCGILLSISAFSVDITLPFFDRMAATLGEPIDAMRATITLYIASIGIGQLFFGPLADRYGRKLPLAGGLLVFLLGALVAATAQSLEQLLAGRVLQGLGAAAAPVVARAIIRDLFDGAALARSMALASGIFSIGPIVGPLIGVLLVSVGGNWRFVFLGMAVYVSVLLLVLLRLPETLTERRPDALHPRRLLHNTRRVLAHRQSAWFMLANTIMLASMLLILSIMPIIYVERYGISGAAFALLFALHGTGIIAGQWLNHRLIAHVGIVRSALYAGIVTIIATALMLLVSLAGADSPLILTALVVLFAVGFLCVISNTISMILLPHGDIAGFTSSLQGAVAQVVGSALAALLSVFIGGALIPWAASLLGIALVVTAMMALWKPEKDAIESEH